MKTFIRLIDGEHLPYFILLLVLVFFSLLMFSSFLFTGSGDLPLQAAEYPQGYYIRSRVAGSVRIIPYAGAAFKSPVSNAIKAVISPYIEDDKDAPQARQKSAPY